MKHYPTNRLVLLNLKGEPSGAVYIPTKEACADFESYLDDDELEFYNKLPGMQRLFIRISTDPFNALKRKMEEK